MFLFQHFSHILEAQVTDREFLEQLHELNHKINFVKEQSFKDAKSCQDVKDILDKLKIKVVDLFHRKNLWASDALWVATAEGMFSKTFVLHCRP